MPSSTVLPSFLSNETPDRIMAVYTEVTDAALTAFLETAPNWMNVEESSGPDAVQTVFSSLVEGNASASTGFIVSMNPGFDE